MQFIDLKKQYEVCKELINLRMEKVFAHGQFIMGPEVNELEDRLSDFVGSKYCITCSSGTDALLISLMALGIGEGDEVLTTPFTFIATAEVIALLGATAVVADINPKTCNIDPTKITDLITDRTKAILPVSLYGQPSDMAEINAIASDYGIPVIEDAAQSFGAEYRGARSCNLSNIGCTSFFPSKPLGCFGDGGAIFTNDDTLAEACRVIRVHGQVERYVHHRIGIGGRMDTLQCAVVLAKLEIFNEELESRSRIAKRYDMLLDDVGVSRVCVESDRSSVYAQYTIFSEDRDFLRKKLQEEGIPTAVHYPRLINDQPAYVTKVRCGELKNAETVSERVVSLPMSAYLTKEDQDSVVRALERFYK